MTEEDRDPTLMVLFAAARRELPTEEFTTQVMLQANRQKRRAIIGRVCVGLLIGLAAIPLEDAATALAQNLVLSVVELEDDLLAQLLSPLNNVGSLLALGLIGLRIVYRKIFH